MAPNTAAPVIACAENVALLHLLHSIPIPPASNPPHPLPVRQKTYALPFEKERSLTGTLAFLSSVKDDPNHITAVCVQEGPNSAFLNVLLAVNKARQGDGHQVLQNLRQGFEKIFTVLYRVTDGVWPMANSPQLLTGYRRRWGTKYREGGLCWNHLHVLAAYTLPSATYCQLQENAKAAP